jgi:hypothetical protein
MESSTGSYFIHINASIKRAEYKGAKNFDFDLYKKIHTQAHTDLKRYGEPVPETKKVKDFLDGITDASLQPVKFTIAGFPNLITISLRHLITLGRLST